MSSPRTGPPAPDTAASERTRIGGRYVLRAEVGRGGMATVHRARDEVLERDVAVKLLHAHLAADPAFLDRFRREARAAAALAHPNVVAVHDWGETDAGPFLVLQLVDGPSLREVLRRRERLTPREALTVLGPAAAGAGAAHRAGLVHRDLKPENLLLGTDGTVRVTDFGLARAAASATSTFGTDVLVGSPHYLSPEAVRGEPLDPRADVYALGVVLYEALVGRPPFEADSPLATAVQHTNRRIPPPSHARPGVPASLDELVRRATAPVRDERYPDGHAFADALQAAVPGAPAPLEVLLGDRAGPTARSSTTTILPIDDVDTTRPAPAGAVPPPVGPVERDGEDTVLGAPTTPAIGPLAGAGAPDALDDLLWPDTPAAPTDVPGAAPDEADDDADDPTAGATERRRRRWPLVVLVLLALLGASAAGGYLLWDRVLAPVLEIPSVVEAPEAAAVATLEELGFEVRVVPERPHSLEVPAGHVLAQEPTGHARQGTVIELVVSDGPRPVELPSLAGATREEAVAALRAEGLEVEVTERHDEEVEEGLVLATEPGPRTVVHEGSTVTLAVSLGREPLEVPSVVGRPLAEAQAALREAGLVPEVSDREFSDDVPSGAVIAQGPGAGKTLFRGDTVSLVVSDGPRPIEVPNVRGERLGPAKATLEDLGFVVEVERRGGFGAFLNPDRVFDQDPAPGSERRPGSTVLLYAYES